MKTFGKIKLNQFSKEELDQRKLNALKGGCICGFSCSCGCSAPGVRSVNDLINDAVSGGTYVYTY